MRDGQRERCSLERLRSSQIAERKTRKVSQQQRQGREYFMTGVAVVSKAAERLRQGLRSNIGFSMKEVE